MFDYLTIEDFGYTYGSKTADNRKFCGHTLVYFQSVTNEVRITFVSDTNYNYNGFNLKFFSLDSSHSSGPHDWCNQTLNESSGFLSSPGYPRPYQFSNYCFYHIKAPMGKKIRMEFLDFDLQENPRCRYNYLEIFDGPDRNYPSIGRYCGNQVLSFIYSTGPDLYLRFESISVLYSGTGFLAQFSFHTSPLAIDQSNQSGSDDYLENIADCNQIIETKGVKIQSPGYPESYPTNMKCVYIIRSPPQETVTLSFHKFSLEGGENCNFDYVKIKDGETAAATVLDKLCGQQEDKTYTSTGRSLRLDFVTDESLGRMGFSASYTFSNCPLRCYNGGTCENHSCKCPNGFQGKQCEIPLGCMDELCRNGATCTERRIGYHCHCTDSHVGYNCEQLKYVVKMKGNNMIRRKDNAIFTCTLNGKKAHRVKWFLNEKLIQRKDDNRIIATDVLYIEKVTEADEGQYMCVIFKERNVYHDSKYLIVEPVCHLRTYQSINRTVAAGQRTVLTCPVLSTSSVKFIWRKGGHPVKLKPRRRVVGDTLMFDPVRSVDQGEYRCIAVGPTGCSAKADIWLTVEKDDYSSEDCGRNSINDAEHNIEAKIKSGYPAAKGSAPWFVLLVDAYTKRSFCGGTLISSNYVVTAAHCIRRYYREFNNTTVQIYLGTQNCSGHGGTMVQMKRWVVHPNFNNATFDKDIAVIQLKESLHFSKKIRPLCLADSEVIEEDSFYPGTYGTVVGCGKTVINYHYPYPRHLHEVKLPYVSDEKCNRSLAVGHSITENMFCAGFSQAHQGDSCKGDSGGPYSIQLPNSKRWILVGIVSWGYNCDQSYTFGVYTNVGQFYQWIKMVIANRRH